MNKNYRDSIIRALATGDYWGAQALARQLVGYNELVQAICDNPEETLDDMTLRGRYI